MDRLLVSVLVSLVAVCACIDSGGQRTPADSTSSDTTAASDAEVVAPCDGPGTTRCSAAGDAVEVCSDGAWRATSCGADRLCVDLGGAQCLQASGDADCRDMVFCYLGCGFAGGASEDACALACYLAGTVPAQGQLAAFVGCLDRAACIAEGDAGDVLVCVSDRCGSQLAQCYFETSGPKSCADIVTCREGCDGDACVQACGQDATLVAQADYGVLELCLLHACAEATTELQQKACIAQATGVGGLCSPFLRKCLGVGGG